MVSWAVLDAVPDRLTVSWIQWAVRDKNAKAGLSEYLPVMVFSPSKFQENLSLLL